MYFLRFLVTGVLVFSGFAVFATRGSAVIDTKEASILGRSAVFIPSGKPAKPTVPQQDDSLPQSLPLPSFVVSAVDDGVLNGEAKESVASEPSTPKKEPASASNKKAVASPVSKAAHAMSPLRRKCLRYYSQQGRREPVSRKDFHAVLESTLPAYETVELEGEKLFLVPGLFSFEQEFLVEKSGSYQWISNRDRMLEGLSPISYRAHVPLAKREDVDPVKQIREQKRWTVELHHLDMEMHGYGLLMIVPGLHRGNEWAYFVDFSGDSPEILHSRIPRDEREMYTSNGSVRLVQDVLHPNLEEHSQRDDDGLVSFPSQIKRSEFEEQRANIWRAIAQGKVELSDADVPGQSRDDDLLRVSRKTTVSRLQALEEEELSSLIRRMRFSSTDEYSLRDVIRKPKLDLGVGEKSDRGFSAEREGPTKRTKRREGASPGTSTPPIFRDLLQSPPSPYKAPRERASHRRVGSAPSRRPLFVMNADRT